MSNELKIYKNRGDFAKSMLVKYFPLAPNIIVSDIGSGFGFMKPFIEAVGGTWQPFDYVKKIEQSIIWDLNKPCPQEAQKAGTIIFLEVLEHLPNPLLSLQHISNHIDTGGHIILTTPNPQNSKNIINLMLKGTLYAFQEKHLQEYHVFTPWEHIVKDFLNTVGFEVVEYACVDTAYQNEKRTGIKSKAKRLLERFFEKRNPKAVGMSYGIVAKKIENR
ncbi:class I SAM-dependent methyltransferase [Winogradskyella ursingii]|uniref:class I SAM-dependent methyltransferase n=1 Tax=Winogradskyella ursingii TaxID=2686079 RepID=UPI0015CAE01F|nr:methyltransferase domain-containing protein [Winogradskyella ursingii]